MFGIISGNQVRMARALLRWSINDLAKESGVGSSTIRRIEDCDGLPKARTENIKAIHDAFTNTGRVRFEQDSGIYIVSEQVQE